MKRPRNRIVIRALVGAAAAIAVVAFAGGRFGAASGTGEEAQAAAPAAPTVMVARPTFKEIVEWDEYTGRFDAIENVEIRARVSGYLTGVAFAAGAIVEKGDLLFRIDPRTFEAELAAARAELASASAALDTARAENARGNQLAERRALSKEEAERRTRQLRQAEAAFAGARARVDHAQLQLEFTEVRAPVTGRISDNFVSQGNLIVGGAQGGTLLTTVVSTDPIYFEFTASEADYLRYLRLDQAGSRTSGRNAAHPVRVRLMDEQEFAHEGTLSFVDNQLDRSTGTMRGRATLANPEGIFSPGMFGRLQLLGSGEYEATLIPDSAVQTDQSEKFVWTVSAEGNAVRVPGELGPIVDGLRVVRGGLARDSRIIVSGTQFVQANAPVVAHQAGDPRLALLGPP